MAQIKRGAAERALGRSKASVGAAKLKLVKAEEKLRQATKKVGEAKAGIARPKRELAEVGRVLRLFVAEEERCRAALEGCEGGGSPSGSRRDVGSPFQYSG